MCLLFAKSGVELLLLSLPPTNDNQFYRFESWALLIGLIVFALLQLWYLHKSLILADPTLVCPLAFCFYNVSSIANSLVYYDTFSELSSLHVGLVGVGTIILLGGVWSVSVQAGDRKGVDIGTAYEGEETAEMAIVDWEGDDSQRPGMVTSNSLPSRLPSDLARTVSGHKRSFTSPPRPSRHLRGITEEGNLEPQDGGSLEQIIEVPTPIEEPARAETSLPLSPPSSRFHFPRRPFRKYTLLSPGRKRRPSSSSTNAPRVDGTLSQTPSQPQNPTNIPFGTGFSIGLSPISPGFSLIPKRPGRSRLGGVRGIVGQLGMRRALSESDITAVRDDEGNTEGAGMDMNGSVPALPSSATAPSPDAPVTATANRAKIRWRWLKSLVGP